MEIVQRALSSLLDHPQNAVIFGKPDPAMAKDILASIVKDGLQEPLIILEDGTILSGHLRKLCLVYIAKSKKKDPDDVMVDVRVHPAFKTKSEELRYLVDANTKRRQLTPQQIANAYVAIKEAKAQEPAAKGGRPKGTSTKTDSKPTVTENLSPSRAQVIDAPDDAARPKPEPESGSGSLDPKGSKRAPQNRDIIAAQFGVGKATVENLETVFTTPNVPEEVKAKVNNATGKEMPKVAKRTADIIRDVLKAQGGAIKDPAAVTAAVAAPPVKKAPQEAAKGSWAERLSKARVEVENVLDDLQLDSDDVSEEVETQRAAVRDGLLDLLSVVKEAVVRLRTGKASKPKADGDGPLNGLLCSECNMPQRTNRSGAYCENGHGGVEGVTPSGLRFETKPETPEPVVAPEPPPVAPEPVAEEDDEEVIIEEMEPVEEPRVVSTQPKPSVPPSKAEEEEGIDLDAILSTFSEGDELTA